MAKLLRAEALALEALRDWVNAKKESNRSTPESLTFHIPGPVSQNFQSKAIRVLLRVGYERIEFRKEDHADGNGNKRTLILLTAHKPHSLQRKIA